MKSVLTSLIFLSVIVTVNPNPVADAGPDHTICLGGSVTLGDGLGMGYTYEWSPTQDLNNPFTHHPVAIPTITTTYTLTVTDANGCTDTDDVIVTVNPLPTADFSLSPTCPVINTDITFTNLSSDATDYHWDFGDGSESTEENPIHQFSEYGYYCVTFIASNACGSDIHQETIFIQPDQCVCDVIYDVPDGTIISTDTTWSGGTKTVEGDIIVNPNVNFTIDSMTLRFAPKARIIVEQQGKLTIGNSTLTNLDVPCANYMWQGIEVWGNDTMPSVSAWQGVINLGQYVKIENAHIGVLLGARNMDYICDPNNLWFHEFNTLRSGGIIKTRGNDDFVNNGIDIKFLRKKYPYDASGNYIYDCQFICNSPLLDPHYSNTSSNPYPNDRNPWAGHYNSYQRTDVGIYIDGQKNFNIRECTFLNKQYCIKSFDSKYNVYSCDFEQAIFGIKIENTLSSIDNRHEISGCFFDKIPNDALIKGAAIFIKAGKYDYIHDNKFGESISDQNKNLYGIFTTNSSSFNISNNKFKRFKYGVKIENSGENGGYVGAWNTSNWIGNEFTQCDKNIITFGNNSKLQLKCNRCNNPEPSLYTVNFENNGSFANQGSMPPSSFPLSFKQKCAAGNEFNPVNISDRRRIKSLDDYSYIYYRHAGPPNVIPEIYPDPNEAIINVFGIGVDKTDNPTACPPLWIIPYPYPHDPLPKLFVIEEDLDNLSNEIYTLQNNYNNFELTLDNGKTYELLDGIYGNTPVGKLKNKLISNSPLSDTVIISLITEYPLSHGNFKNVMQVNLPVSKKTEPVFYEKLKTIPHGIVNQLKKLQAYNPDYTTLASIQREIDNITQQRQLFLNELIILLTDTVNNRKDDAITLLENEGTTGAEQTLIATYIADSNLTDAATKLANIPVDDPEVYDWVQLNYILLNLYDQGKTLYQLDSLQIQFIRDLAYKCPAGLGTSNAQAILDLLYREEVPECPAEINIKSLNIPGTSDFADTNKEDEILGKNYPDPFNNTTTIPYCLPDDIKGTIEIRDVSGRLIAQYKVFSSENTIKVNTKNWSPGIYTYSLIIKDMPMISKKMVITK